MNCEWFHRSYWKLLALLHLMLFRLHFYDFYVIRFHVIIPLCMIRRRDGKLNLKNHHQSRFTFVRFSALDSTPKHNPLIVIAKGNYKSELPNPFRELFSSEFFFYAKISAFTICTYYSKWLLRGEKVETTLLNRALCAGSGLNILIKSNSILPDWIKN